MSLQVNMEHHVVLDGFPANIAPAKREMFKKLLEKKIAAEVGHVNYAVKLLTDDKDFVSGAFIDCRSVQEADNFVAKLHKYKFTKGDVFDVNRWSDFSAAMDIPDAYEAPEEEELIEIDMTNPFMLDAAARPQLILKAGEGYDVSWYHLNPQTNKLDMIRTPTSSHNEASTTKSWSEMDRRAKRLQPAVPQPLPLWSPQGTYLITQHPGTVRLWGGKSMQATVELPAAELHYISMSPSEKYLIIFGREFNFWDVQNARIIRSIPGVCGPTYKYNADDTMVACIHPGKGALMVYEASTMKLMTQELPPKHTMQEDGLCSFAWSPTNPNMFAHVVSGDDSIGFRVTIEKIVDAGDNMVDLSPVARRNYFQTDRIDLLWHPDGTHLAAKILKSKGTTSFGVFRIGQHTASAEALDVKGEPLRFAWQPNGSRFAIIVSHGAHKQNIMFYDVAKMGFKEVGSFPSEGVRIHWAPKGTRCTSINFDKSRLEFYGVQGSGPFASDQKMTAISSVEHPMITHGEWDPTGRYFCSYTSSLEQQMDNSYMLWNVNGLVLVDRVKIPRLSHVSWRPLARSLLASEEVAKIRKTLPQKSLQYNTEYLASQKKNDESSTAKKKSSAANYIKVMDAIERTHQEKEWDAARDKLVRKAPAMRRQLDAITNAKPIMAETMVEADE
jgi:translation initiation factor 3 subunit B